MAGFYDERPEKRRLYAVSEDRSFSPMNQIVLVHELRHALQDQYADLDSHVASDLSDFDDRRMAWVSLLEGDATLVMERFVRLRLGGLGLPLPDAGGAEASAPGSPGLFDIPGAAGRPGPARPALPRGSRLRPRRLGARGAPALREAWARPPDSTEQILHPEKFFARRSRGLWCPRFPRRAGRGSCPRASSESSSSGRSSRRGGRRRGRVGWRRVASLGGGRPDGPRLARRVGRRPRRPPSSTPRSGRGSCGVGRPRPRPASRCSGGERPTPRPAAHGRRRRAGLRRRPGPPRRPDRGLTTRGGGRGAPAT